MGKGKGERCMQHVVREREEVAGKGEKGRVQSEE